MSQRKLLVCTFIISLVWVFSQHVTFSSDSVTFLQYAKWLVGEAEISPFWYLRNPGLPIILILTGVTKFNTFLGFMILQALFSVGIVECIYSIVKATQPKFAILISWLCIFTCVPFIFSTMITTEQANLYGFCLLIYALVLFTTSQQKKFIFLAAAANIFLFLLRPNNYYIFVITTCYLAFYSQKHRLQNILRFLVPYGTVMLLYIVCFGLLKLSHPGLEGMSSVFQGVRAVAYYPYAAGALDTLTKDQNPNGDNYNILTADLAAKYGRKEAAVILLKESVKAYAFHPNLFVGWVQSIFTASANNYTGQMLFYPLMLKAQYILPSESGLKYSKISSENGPATAAMLQHLSNYIKKREYIWRDWEPFEYFANFSGHPEALLINIFQNPNHVYHAFIWQALDREIGPVATSQLFMAAAIEGLKKYPSSITCFFDDLASYFFSLDVTYKSGARVMFLPTPGVGEKANSHLLSATMLQQINSPIFNVNKIFWDNLYGFYGYVWLLAKVFIFVFAVIGLGVASKEKFLSVFLLIWALIMYNALITSVFADPFFRYSALTWLLTTVVALQACCSLLENKLPFLSSKKIIREY